MFEARHPGCQVTLQGVPVTEPYAALRAGEIDVLIHWLVVDERDPTPGPAIDRLASIHRSIMGVSGRVNVKGAL